MPEESQEIHLTDTENSKIILVQSPKSPKRKLNLLNHSATGKRINYFIGRFSISRNSATLFYKSNFIRTRGSLLLKI